MYTTLNPLHVIQLNTPLICLLPIGKMQTSFLLPLLNCDTLRSYIFLANFPLIAPDGPRAQSALSHYARGDLWQVNTCNLNCKPVISGRRCAV